MQAQNKPRLGVLALMLEGYEPLFPGITARQARLCGGGRFVAFGGGGVRLSPRGAEPRRHRGHRGRVQRAGAGRHPDSATHLFAGQYLVHAMQRNSLPLALALVQPDETVGDDFEELELTVNQGIHGSQDNAQLPSARGHSLRLFRGQPQKTGSSPPSSGTSARRRARWRPCGACASA